MIGNEFEMNDERVKAPPAGKRLRAKHEASEFAP